jgi:general secretion pathway protein J
MNRQTRTTSKGFTLVEVLVASTIGAFVSLTAVGAFMAFTESADYVEDKTDQAAELRLVANLLGADLANLYRDKSFRRMKLVGGMDSSDTQHPCDLTFYTVSRANARTGQPEGDVYEVEYYIAQTEDKSLFMRRRWPNPHEEAEPGGLLTVLSEAVTQFQVRFYDGEQWLEQWDQTQRTLPLLLEITLVSQQEGHKEPLTEYLFINFPRYQGDRGADTEAAQGASSEEGARSDTGTMSESRNNNETGAGSRE